MSFRCVVVTPEQQTLDETVTQAILPAHDGLLGILTDRSPLLVKATTEGVVRAPSEFSKTTGSPPSMTDMQELVVPKSIPKTLAIK